MSEPGVVSPRRPPLIPASDFTESDARSADRCRCRQAERGESGVSAWPRRFGLEWSDLSVVGELEIRFATTPKSVEIHVGYARDCLTHPVLLSLLLWTGLTFDGNSGNVNGRKW